MARSAAQCVASLLNETGVPGGAHVFIATDYAYVVQDGLVEDVEHGLQLMLFEPVGYHLHGPVDAQAPSAAAK